MSTADRDERLPDHTPRGFAYIEFEYRDYRGSNPRHFSVQASSLATEDKVWIGPDEVMIHDGSQSFEAPRAHLGFEDAVKVRNALSAWIESRSTMMTPEQIATDSLTGYALGRDITREDVWQIVRDAIATDREIRHVVGIGEVIEQMATDKSNDWSEEIAILEEIEMSHE